MNAAGAASERGAGSILAVTIMAAVLALASLTIPLYMVLSAKHRAAGAADAAALAAADVSVGIVPGTPCTVASTVARANDAELIACQVDGLVVTVLVTVEATGLSVPAAATAGPPGAAP